MDPIAQRAMYQEAAERLRGLIYRGELAPGAWIDERTLAERFRISRTPLREALKVLHAEGLVRLTPRRGAFVAGELTPQDLDELFPVIALLEGLCAREAVGKATDADVRHLELLHDRLERHAAAGDVEGYDEGDWAFHAAVQEVAANRWLSRMVSELRGLLRLLRGRPLRVPVRLQQSLAEHRRLQRAVRRRDAEEAERIMRTHLLSQRAALSADDAAASDDGRRRGRTRTRGSRRGGAPGGSATTGRRPRARRRRP
jgi:DNA-binding GntR family transcriptional regulator